MKASQWDRIFAAKPTKTKWVKSSQTYPVSHFEKLPEKLLYSEQPILLRVIQFIQRFRDCLQPTSILDW